MNKKPSTTKNSWQILEQHPILLLPVFIGIMASAIWFILILVLWNTVASSDLSPIAAMITQIMLIALYLVIEGYIIFHTSLWNYSVYQRHIIGKNITKQIRFYKSNFLSMTGLSLFAYTAVGIPTIAIILIFISILIGPLNEYVNALYLAILTVWVIFFGIRLIRMHYHEQHYHKSRTPGFVFLFHTYTQHTLVGWLGGLAFIIMIAIAQDTLSGATAFEIWLATLAAICVITCEVVFSVWERLVLFQLHIKEKVHIKQHL